MIAEIRNKISSSGSNLSDRLEDQLTGNVFGALRYLPAELGLAHALSNARFESKESLGKWWQALKQLRGYQATFKFWPPHEEGEIDLLLDHPEVLIGVEVKYYSSLSSEDEEVIRDDADLVESRNQLARYARMLTKYERGSRPKFLLFLAPVGILTEVQAAMESRPIIPEGVNLGYLSWQEILESIQGIDMRPLEAGQQIILQDIMDLLVKKGFIRFTGFETGIEHFQLTSHAYIFRETKHDFAKIQWSANSTKSEEHYVYHRSSRA